MIDLVDNGPYRGEHIKRLLKDRDLTISEAARRLGVSRVYLSQLVNGKRKQPSVKIVKGFSKMLGVSMEEVLRGDLRTQDALYRNELDRFLAHCWPELTPDEKECVLGVLKIVEENRELRAKQAHLGRIGRLVQHIHRSTST